MILPAIQITFFTATVGGDVRDVTLDYTNLDNSKFLVCIVQSLCNDMAKGWFGRAQTLFNISCISESCIE